MVLPVTSVGDSAQVPGIAAETYIPDQLIAGNLKLVSQDAATITGGAALKRGTVLGIARFGSVTASTGTANASGTIAVAAVPTAGDTVTIFGTAIAMTAADPSGNQVLIGADTATTAANLVNFLDASLDTNLVKGLYTLTGSTITATSKVAGTGGNALTLATSNSSAFTLSGATLSGGTNNTGNATVGSISAGPQLEQGQYIAICTDATHAAVTSPLGENLGTATFGTAFTNPQINFTITAGGTPCVANDRFVLQSAATSGGFKICNVDATDGSEVPAAVLADDADATSGDVVGGVYVTGEFNGNRLIYGRGWNATTLRASWLSRASPLFVKNVVSALDPI